MADKSKINRAEFQPHCNNMDAKIKSGNTVLTTFKNNYYIPFVKEISKINFCKRDLRDYGKACSLIDEYYAKLSEVVHDNNIDTRSGIKSSFIEEISKYLFENHPIIKKEKLLFENSRICTGLFFSKDTLKTTEKDVDFCICREKKIKMGKETIEVKIPIISVECKTHMDGTMFNEVIDTATRLHTSSPDSHNFVFMLWNQVGRDTFTIRRKATNVTEFFSLMKKPKNKSEEYNIKTNPEVLLKYYDKISESLDDYFVEYIFPEYGTYLN